MLYEQSKVKYLRLDIKSSKNYLTKYALQSQKYALKLKMLKYTNHILNFLVIKLTILLVVFCIYLPCNKII